MNWTITKDDKKANRIIFSFSFIIFAAVILLGRVTLDVNLGFDPHVFAALNAIINTIVATLLIAGIITAKNQQYAIHKRIMLTAMVLSIAFLVSYICHHLFAGDTSFKGQGIARYFYYTILITHIMLAAIVLPFILFTAYRALIDERKKHKKLARLTWPIWFFVAVTGPIIYLMISQYY